MRRPRARIPMLLLVLASAPAGAQTIVTSAAPDRVAVTVYRAPHRDADDPMDLQWLDGYALISETRQVTIPAGTSDIRFEGVAGGILPQSAIVTGFPDGVVERNRDAYLLSPATLLDRSLGRRVHLRRTSRATGTVTEQDAIVMSGADGAVVLRTAEGFEALHCTGQAEMPSYDEVPAGLSARPTLSVRARSAQPVTATITLSYLSSGFDWQANYVAQLSPDGSSVNLFAWLTLASMDETSFHNADTQAVAGRLNRTATGNADRDGISDWLQLRCWPAGTTSGPERVLTSVVPGTVVNSAEIRLQGVTRTENLMSEDESAIMVTGTRAVQEELGDLKLYRIPEPVTVAARSQKQVAFLQQPRVSVSIVYRHRQSPDDIITPHPANRFLVTRNRREEGLGLPLPAGGVQLFTLAGERPILIGEGAMRDRAVGEDVEIAVGEATGVHTEVDYDVETDEDDWYILTVTNDQAAPARYEMEFELEEGSRLHPRAARLARRNGMPLWRVTVPANGRATLRYRVTYRTGE